MMKTTLMRVLEIWKMKEYFEKKMNATEMDV